MIFLTLKLLVDVFLLKKCVTRVSTGQVSTDGHFFILVEVIFVFCVIKKCLLFIILKILSGTYFMKLYFGLIMVL